MNPTNDFLPDILPPDPMPLAHAWLMEAWEKRPQPNPDAMVIATADAQGNPSARVVLCKGIVADPGYLLFYTNYDSRKGRELEAHPRAAAVLFWDAWHRQLRVEGPIVKSPAAESDAYFGSRARDRRIGAWASQQSQPVGSRAALLEAVGKANAQYPEEHVPRPPHWGGYRLWAESVELWTEGDARIHDRARWTRTLRRVDERSFTAGSWSATRLQP